MLDMPSEQFEQSKELSKAIWEAIKSSGIGRSPNDPEAIQSNIVFPALQILMETMLLQMSDIGMRVQYISLLQDRLWGETVYTPLNMMRTGDQKPS